MNPPPVRPCRPPRPHRRRRAAVLLGALVAAGATTAGCGAGSPQPSADTSPATAAPASTAPASTAPATTAVPGPPATTAGTPSTTTAAPTTTAVPADPQSTPDEAGNALVAAWERGDPGTAATVATPRAVRQLFAHAYTGEVVQDRGCPTPGVNPVVCTYGPYGGASSSEAIYELTVRPGPTGWYVTGVERLG